MSEQMTLSTDLEQLEEFHQEGFEVIEHWCQMEKLPSDVPEERQPPDVSLMQKSEELLELAIKIRNEDKSELYNILVGVATEILLSAITLREDCGEFIIESNGSKKSIAFNDAKTKVLIPCLKEELNSEKKDRLCRVLKLIWEQRNNSVHIGYHRADHHPWTTKETYRVIAYLLEKFFPDEENLSNDLREKANQYESKISEANNMDYPSVGF